MVPLYHGSMRSPAILPRPALATALEMNASRPVTDPISHSFKVLGERVPIKSEKTRICIIRAHQLLFEIEQALSAQAYRPPPPRLPAHPHLGLPSTPARVPAHGCCSTFLQQ